MNSNKLDFSFIKIFSLFFLVFIFSATLLPQDKPSSRSQSKLELLHADLSKGVTRNGQSLKILEGNVHARQDSLQLYCDRAEYNPREKKLSLIGNVKLIRGQDTLLSRRLNYFEDNKIAIAEENVRVYRPNQEMRAHYLEYHYESEKIRAADSLYLYDEENRVTITAQKGEYLPDQERSFVEMNSHFVRIDSSGTDTLHIFSRRMEYYFGKERHAIALDSVRIFQGKLNATCDSAIYLIEEDIINLEINPHSIQENNEMFGDHIQLLLNDMELEQIQIQGNAKVLSVKDSITQKENRLEGNKIIMFITNRTLKEVWSISNARSKYYLEEEQEERGVNVASADTIKAFFNQSELDSISVIGGSQGTYYPENYKGPITAE